MAVSRRVVAAYVYGVRCDAYGAVNEVTSLVPLLSVDASWYTQSERVSVVHKVGRERTAVREKMRWRMLRTKRTLGMRA